jgi:hypothetical protein
VLSPSYGVVRFFMTILLPLHLARRRRRVFTDVRHLSNPGSWPEHGNVLGDVKYKIHSYGTISRGNPASRSPVLYCCPIAGTGPSLECPRVLRTQKAEGT